MALTPLMAEARLRRGLDGGGELRHEGGITRWRVEWRGAMNGGGGVAELDSTRRGTELTGRARMSARGERRRRGWKVPTKEENALSRRRQRRAGQTGR
jgi:hypothetical protein